MAKKRNAFIDLLQYLVIRTAASIFHWFPVNLNLQTARIFASVWYRLDHKHRQRALTNLTRSFPDLTPEQADALGLASMQHLFMLGVEILFTTRMVHLETWRQYIQFDDIGRTLNLLLNRKSGLIMLTGHYGNWEILGYILGVLGFETISVARVLDNPYLNDWMFAVRAGHGQRIINKKGATTEVADVLGQGGVVAFVADQNAGSKGMFVDFFGRKASTYKSIGLLAMQFEVPIIIGYARRLQNCYNFHLGTQDIIYPADWKNESDPLRYITQRYTKAVEDMVRAEPSQYLWMHRRWKSRPKGEEPMPYD